MRDCQICKVEMEYTPICAEAVCPVCFQTTSDTEQEIEKRRSCGFCHAYGTKDGRELCFRHVMFRARRKPGETLPAGRICESFRLSVAKLAV